MSDQDQRKDNSVQSLHHLLAMQLICMGNVQIGSSYTFHPIAFVLCQMYLPKIVRQCGQLSSLPPGSAAHL